MSMAAALDTYMTGAFSSVHTSIPATVVKYDEGSHRAQVKPSVRMLMDNGIQIELPIRIDLLQVPRILTQFAVLPVVGGAGENSVLKVFLQVVVCLCRRPAVQSLV